MSRRLPVALLSLGSLGSLLLASCGSNANPSPASSTSSAADSAITRLSSQEDSLMRAVYRDQGVLTAADFTRLLQDNPKEISQHVGRWRTVCESSPQVVAEVAKEEVRKGYYNWIDSPSGIVKVHNPQRLEWMRQAAEQLCPDAAAAALVRDNVDQWKDDFRVRDRARTRATLAKQRQERLNSIEPGKELVGEDVQAGTYATPGGKNCYWERTDRNGNTIDNGFTVYKTRVQVDIQASDYAFYSRNCGDWTRQS